MLSTNELVVSRVLDRWRGHSGVDAPWVHVHPSLPLSSCTTPLLADQTSENPTNDVPPVTSRRIATYPFAPLSSLACARLAFASLRIRLASLLARIPPINNRHALFSLPFRVVEHPSSSTDFAIAIRIDEFALTPLAPRKSALERI